MINERDRWLVLPVLSRITVGLHATGISTLAASLCFASTAVLCAQSVDPAASFPARPIRIVIGFTPGGQPDITARVIAVKVTESLGQQVVIDNRPGAGGTLGTKIVADATPDGHTLL